MCEDCNQAKANWDWSGFHQDCEDCLVRALALASNCEHHRFYNEHLADLPGGRMLVLRDLVERERARIQALKMLVPNRWWQKQA